MKHEITRLLRKSAVQFIAPTAVAIATTMETTSTNVPTNVIENELASESQSSPSETRIICHDEIEEQDQMATMV